MVSKDSSDKNKLLTAAEFSEILGVQPRRIQQLANEGALVKAGHGKYDLIQSLRAFIDYQVSKRAPVVDEEKLDPGIENALWIREKREKTKLEVQIIKGELHRSNDVERITSDMLGAFRSKLLNLPMKVAPLVQAKTDLNEINKTIQYAIHEAMTELAEYDPKIYYEQSADKLVLNMDSDEAELDVEGN